jgi:hypothetical protein
MTFNLFWGEEVTDIRKQTARQMLISSEGKNWGGITLYLVVKYRTSGNDKEFMRHKYLWLYPLQIHYFTTSLNQTSSQFTSLVSESNTYFISTEQGVPERRNRLKFGNDKGWNGKRRAHQFFCSCLCNLRGWNSFTAVLPSNDVGNQHADTRAYKRARSSRKHTKVGQVRTLAHQVAILMVCEGFSVSEPPTLQRKINICSFVCSDLLYGRQLPFERCTPRFCTSKLASPLQR